MLYQIVHWLSLGCPVALVIWLALVIRPHNEASLTLAFTRPHNKTYFRPCNSVEAGSSTGQAPGKSVSRNALSGAVNESRVAILCSARHWATGLPTNGVPAAFGTP